MAIYIKVFSLFFIVHYTHSAVLDLTCEDIRAFIDGHNNRRFKLTKGQIEGQPPATDLQVMVWDQELAKKAEQWAATYSFEHNPDSTLASERFTIGENIYKSRSTNKNYKIKIDDAIESWFSENANFTFAPISDDNFGPGHPPIGHYTQMVWANSVYLGCAISYELDEDYKSYYVICDYGPSGNYDGQTPYTPGSKDGYYSLVCNTYPGCDHPYGEDCKFDVWDQELANKAAQWAATYSFEHNPDRSLASKRFTIGENIYKSSSTNKNYKIKIDDVIASWFSENANFTFAPISDDNFGPGHPPIGHYTQMVWANSVYLGCAISYELDEDYKSYYVICDYGPSGNYDGQTPYTPGKDDKVYKMVCKSYLDCQRQYGQECKFD